MNLDDYVREKIKAAPECNCKAWLDQEVEKHGFIKEYPYFDEKDRLIAIQAYKCMLYLFDRYKRYNTDPFMDLSNQSTCHSKDPFVWYCRLYSEFDRTQLEGFRNALNALRDLFEEDLPDGLELQAEIDPYGSPVISQKL